MAMVATSDQNHSYVKCPSHRKSTQNTNGKLKKCYKCKEVCNRALLQTSFKKGAFIQSRVILRSWRNFEIPVI